MLATFLASMLITITVVVKLLAAVEELSHHGIRATAHIAAVCSHRGGCVLSIALVEFVVASFSGVADVVPFCRQYLKRCRRRKAAGFCTADETAQSRTTSSYLGDNTTVSATGRELFIHHHSPTLHISRT